MPTPDLANPSICIIIVSSYAVVRIISIARDATGNFLDLNGNGVTARISLANPAQADTSANNLLAYIPSYVGDFHASGLGTVFINLDDLFPCLQGRDPTCFRATAEEDGLNKGQDILEAADGGNNLLVWGAGVQRYTYAFAIQGCAELSVECLPTFYAFSVVCLLPREQCG